MFPPCPLTSVLLYALGGRRIRRREAFLLCVIVYTYSRRMSFIFARVCDHPSMRVSVFFVFFSGRIICVREFQGERINAAIEGWENEWTVSFVVDHRTYWSVLKIMRMFGQALTCGCDAIRSKHAPFELKVRCFFSYWFTDKRKTLTTTPDR